MMCLYGDLLLPLRLGDYVVDSGRKLGCEVLILYLCQLIQGQRALPLPVTTGIKI